ncbi:uncharacterized protein V6R79_014185 [Siganus canaliculatus]
MLEALCSVTVTALFEESSVSDACLLWTGTQGTCQALRPLSFLMSSPLQRSHPHQSGRLLGTCFTGIHRFDVLSRGSPQHDCCLFSPDVLGVVLVTTDMSECQDARTCLAVLIKTQLLLLVTFHSHLKPGEHQLMAAGRRSLPMMVHDEGVWHLSYSEQRETSNHSSNLKIQSTNDFFTSVYITVQNKQENILM